MQPDKLRIVHVFRAPLGGLFRHVLDLATQQAARGHEVGLFFDSGGMSERVESALSRVTGGLKLGTRTFSISRNPGLKDIAAFGRFSLWLREVRPDVVHGHGSKGGFLARMSAFSRIPGNPIRAYTPHGGSFNYRPGSRAFRVFMAAERFMAHKTDLFLFESDNIREKFDESVGSKTGIRRVVVNGLSESEFERAKPGPNAADILYVGELRAAKGVDTLLEALALVAKTRNAPPTAVLVGSGPDREALVERAAKLGLTDHVVFAGPVPMDQALTRGRIMVAPSRAESMPYVVLEGVAAELPMITTDVGGIPEIFGPYRDRLGPSDDPENLARRITAQLDMPLAESRTRAADLAKFVKDNFRLATMTDSVLESYRDAITRRLPRSVGAVAPAVTTY